MKQQFRFFLTLQKLVAFNPVLSKLYNSVSKFVKYCVSLFKITFFMNRPFFRFPSFWPLLTLLIFSSIFSFYLLYWLIIYYVIAYFYLPIVLIGGKTYHYLLRCFSLIWGPSMTLILRILWFISAFQPLGVSSVAIKQKGAAHAGPLPCILKKCYY